MWLASLRSSTSKCCKLDARCCLCAPHPVVMLLQHSKLLLATP